MDTSFNGLTAATLPWFIEIKNEGDGLVTFGDNTLPQQIELILEGPQNIPENIKTELEEEDDSNTDVNDAKSKDALEESMDHEVTTKSDEVYNCSDCSESFDTKEIYDIHMSGHANNMKCAICNMVLKSLKNYEKHCLRCKPYECQICGRVVRFRPNFIKHMRVHTGQQSERHKYKCEVCQKEFMSFEYFKVHKKIHNENVNLTCEVCGKVFSALASLRGHSKLHTGIKLHKCDVCGKGFGQRYNLKIHSRVHTGEVPYECKLCKRKLHTLSSYQTHMQTHDKDQNIQQSEEAPVDKEEAVIPYEVIADIKDAQQDESSELSNLPECKIEHPEDKPPEEMLNLSPKKSADVPFELSLKQESEMKCADQNSLDVMGDEKLLTDSTESLVVDATAKYQSEFDGDLVDSSDLTNTLSYSTLFESSSIPESIAEEMYDDEHFQLDQNSLELQTTTDGNFIKKEWVYSNYAVGQKFDEDDFCETASFIYD